MIWFLLGWSFAMMTASYVLGWCLGWVDCERKRTRPAMDRRDEAEEAMRRMLNDWEHDRAIMDEMVRRAS